MPIRKYKPTSPARRSMSVSTFEEITKKRPERSLIEPLKKHAGRNNRGRITTRHQGGRQKRFYRIIDFKRNKIGVPAKVAAIEYDPNRSARIALLFYADGEKRYMLAPLGVKVGDMVVAGPDAPIRVGNALPLRNIPVGTIIHNVELKPRAGGQLARSAGSFAQLIGRDGDWSQLRLASGEIRRVRSECMASIGAVSNPDHQNVNYGKAGRMRWKGRRPHNRGVSMNPVDHPHGGGEGKTSGGRHPVTPWGQPTRGFKTRNNKRTDKWIVTRKAKKR